jgi:hypothetical protein
MSTSAERRSEGQRDTPDSGTAQAASLNDQAVTAERCAAQLLDGDPAGSAEQLAGRLLAIQAQDPRGARLAIRARSAGLSASDVDAALNQWRALIVTWLNRGTLHLIRAEDYWWLHPLTTPQLRTGNSRWLAQEGVPPQDAERAVAAVRTALAAGGPLTRSQLRERVAAAGVRTEGQAMVHILALASIRGLIVRGPVTGRDQAFVLVQGWLGTPPPTMGRGVALAELAQRFLAGHAPAVRADAEAVVDCDAVCYQPTAFRASTVTTNTRRRAVKGHVSPDQRLRSRDPRPGRGGRAANWGDGSRSAAVTVWSAPGVVAVGWLSLTAIGAGGSGTAPASGAGSSGTGRMTASGSQPVTGWTGPICARKSSAAGRSPGSLAMQRSINGRTRVGT